MTSRMFWCLLGWMMFLMLPGHRREEALAAPVSPTAALGCTLGVHPRCAHEPGEPVTFWFNVSNGANQTRYFVITLDMIKSELISLPPLSSTYREFQIVAGTDTRRLHPKGWCKEFSDLSQAQRLQQRAQSKVDEIKALLPAHAQHRASIAVAEASLLSAIEQNSEGSIASLLEQLDRLEANDERSVLTKIRRAQNSIERYFGVPAPLDAVILQLDLHSFDLQPDAPDRFVLVPEGSETSPGFTLPKNDDDDNVNGVPDSQEDSVAGEKGTSQLWWFFGKPIDVAETLELEALAGNLRFWQDRSKGAPASLPKAVSDGFSRDRVFLEGVAESPAEGQEQLYASLVYQGHLCQDQVQGTVEAIRIIEFKAPEGAVAMFGGEANFQKGGNPNPGKGDRIFPDRNVPGGPLNEKLKVRATVSPVREGRRVYFKPFDVDDPSSAALPIDDEVPPEDNRGTVNGTPHGFITGADPDRFASDDTDADGVAEVEFTVTRQPGDNFRIAAAVLLFLLQDNRVQVAPGHDPDANIKDGAGNPLPKGDAPPAARRQSDLLTVWRQLHVEIDTMEAPPRAGTFATGTIAALEEGVIVHLANIVSGVDIADGEGILDTTGDLGRFQGGRLVIPKRSGGLLDVPVVQNGDTMVFPSGSLTEFEADIVGQTFQLFDDDVIDHANPLPPPNVSLLSHSDDPAKNLLAPAYVMPFYDEGGTAGNNERGVTFDLNLEETPAELGPHEVQGTLAAGYDSSTEDRENFWVVYLQSVFQLGTEVDNDSDDEFSILGLTTELGRQRIPAAVIMMEPIHEFAPTAAQRVILESQVVAHEVGHQVNAKHGDLGVMGDQAGTTPFFSGFNVEFSDASRARIRSILRPTVGD